MDHASLPDSNDGFDSRDLTEPLSRFKPDRRATLMRFFQNLDFAETPPDPTTPKYHTGKLPNSKSGDGKPRLLLMGQKRSGKSSINSVVFHKNPPNETLYLETTKKIEKNSMHSFMDFQVWDFPGHLDYFDPAFDEAQIFSEIGALIWVIDAQDEYLDAIQRLNATILHLQQTYPLINVEVFVHKVDGLSDDYRVDTFRDIVQRVQDELLDHGVETAPVHFHQTSIYDHSIFEALSKVIQKLIPQLPTLEALLNSLCRNCHIEKAYLFDLVSKIYIATDTSPTDIGSYEICSDYIDVIIDITEIYGLRPEEEDNRDVSKSRETGNGPAESLITLEKKGNYLYLREVHQYLCLICILGDDSPTERKALIDYNVGVFQEALQQVFPR
ncbi:hypothetical protein BLS_002474 [Venturia inaequalis]|uniref:GTP-binding protein n=1 Tax=Venturia inaequalis TaxID=5025 RepID=A0A8H3UUF0_VENIN|nr:hypothetical protein BLS_002474 [Venturia inaequalis]KAE9982766.1 hypothetical protein EG328_010630 [Venturia inaequalis]KAE9994355.1 hypothetical protein EG327_010795 [Venturia inaequalis]RDI78856.1 hypothetical protein Vi05172_g11143 [Venturia inaequalis]